MAALLRLEKVVKRPSMKKLQNWVDLLETIFPRNARHKKASSFVLKKVEEKWYGEEWQGEKLAKKVEIHAQKSEPMSPPDKSQEKPKDGGKESGKPKEVPAGKEPVKAADGKEKGK